MSFHSLTVKRLQIYITEFFVVRFKNKHIRVMAGFRGALRGLPHTSAFFRRVKFFTTLAI